jgi:ATP-dependent protease ClpP protease subunit
MAKDILIYGYISEYSARYFFQQIAEAVKDDENGQLVFRVNTDGGEPKYGWGMLNKIQETENKKVVVDGAANSMGAFACLYCDDVEAVDTAEFCFHRAAYPSWFESNPDYFDDFEQKRLANTNAKLKKAFEAKVDVKRFEEITGKTVKDLFSMEGRVEVVLTAAQAKECKVISSITKLTPTRKSQIDAFNQSVPMECKMNADASKPLPKPIPAQKSEDMTIEKLKAEFPAIYAAIYTAGKEDGIKDGVKKENDRIMAWMAYASIDAKKVNEGIQKGEEVTTRVMAEFQAVTLSADYLTKIKADSAKEIKTGTTTETETDPVALAKKKEIADFSAGIDALIGIKKKEPQAA